MADDEGPRSAGGSARYARVGASVGGLAARLAGQRYLGLSLDRDKHAAELKARAGRAEGPADEGGAAAGHHPRRAAAGICPRTGAAPGQCAGHGLGLRAPPHGAGARARLAGEVPALRQGGVVRRLARPGSPRRRCKDGRERGGEAAVSRHGLGARSRPRPAQGRVRDRPALRPGDPHRRDPCRDPQPPARGARLSPRGPARARSTALCCATSSEGACAGDGARASRPSACSPWAGWQGEPLLRLEGARRRRSATRSPSPCSAPGTCRSISTA